jgi:hypothetical protein
VRGKEKIVKEEHSFGDIYSEMDPLLTHMGEGGGEKQETDTHLVTT